MSTTRILQLDKNYTTAKKLSKKFKISEERALEIMSYLSRTLHITDNAALVTLFTFIAINIPSILRVADFVLFPTLAVHEVALTTLKWIEFIKDAKKNGIKTNKLVNLLGESAPSAAIVAGVILVLLVSGPLAGSLIAGGLGFIAGHEAERGISNLVKAFKAKDPLERKYYFKKARNHGIACAGNGLAAAGVIVAGILSHGMAGAVIGGAGCGILLAAALEDMVRFCKEEEAKNRSPFDDIRLGTTIVVKTQPQYQLIHNAGMPHYALISKEEDKKRKKHKKQKGTTVYANARQKQLGYNTTANATPVGKNSYFYHQNVASSDISRIDDRRTITLKS